MVGKVSNFTGISRDNRQLLTCPDCASATFKVVKRGASEVPKMECSNCECEMAGVTINV